MGMTPDTTATPDHAQAAAQQELFIRQARDLLCPSPVRAGMPNWFRLACLRTFGPLPYGTSQWAVADFLRNRFGRWLDHVGRCEYHGRDAYVAEPYDIDLTAVQNIAELAAAIACQWEIDPNSWHYPGRTLRVVIFQREPDDQRERKPTP